MTSGEKKNRALGRAGINSAWPLPLQKSGGRAKKQSRGIEDQKSSQEKIKIRTLKTVGCGTRLGIARSALESKILSLEINKNRFRA